MAFAFPIYNKQSCSEGKAARSRRSRSGWRAEEARDEADGANIGTRTSSEGKAARSRRSRSGWRAEEARDEADGAIKRSRQSSIDKEAAELHAEPSKRITRNRSKESHYFELILCRFIRGACIYIKADIKPRAPRARAPIDITAQLQRNDGTVGGAFRYAGDMDEMSHAD